MKIFAALAALLFLPVSVLAFHADEPNTIFKGERISAFDYKEDFRNLGAFHMEAYRVRILNTAYLKEASVFAERDYPVKSYTVVTHDPIFSPNTFGYSILDLRYSFSGCSKLSDGGQLCKTKSFYSSYCGAAISKRGVGAGSLEKRYTVVFSCDRIRLKEVKPSLPARSTIEKIALSYDPAGKIKMGIWYKDFSNYDKTKKTVPGYWESEAPTRVVSRNPGVPNVNYVRKAVKQLWIAVRTPNALPSEPVALHDVVITSP